jgi:hypothetical protein
VRLFLHNRSDPVVLPGVGGDVAKNTQLRDVRVVFWVEAFELWVQSLVAGAQVALIVLAGEGVHLAGALQVDVLTLGLVRVERSFLSDSLHISDI